MLLIGRWYAQHASLASGAAQCDSHLPDIVCHSPEMNWETIQPPENNSDGGDVSILFALRASAERTPLWPERTLAGPFGPVEC